MNVYGLFYFDKKPFGQAKYAKMKREYKKEYKDGQ